MSEEMMVKHCSPTLAGMKTANIFTCYFENSRELRDSLIYWNRLLVKKGLRVISLRYKNKRALIYVYRPARLSRDLAREEVGALLRDYGYSPEEAPRCISRLMKRIEENDEFPHEIGLFLGYPPEDVLGFIKNEKPCKLSGLWKVYGDENEAKRLFEKYRRCTSRYCSHLAQGGSIERLALKRA